jgi:hypothetical protein
LSKRAERQNASKIWCRHFVGKDSLPSYPFFVLCILQALESKKTSALEGGSFGPLFEILILSALEKTKADDLQISLKLVFMQELAFYMWTKRTTSVSRREIDAIMLSYAQTHLMDLPVTRFLEDLEKTKLITSFDGNFSFMYPHYMYYAVARYIRDHIEDDGANELRIAVDKMIDCISSIENSTILMFLIYFEKDKHRIIDRIVHNASIIYADVPPAKLEEETAIFSSLQTSLHPPSIEEDQDIAKNRHEKRVIKDTQEESLANQENPQSSQLSFVYGYSDDLTDSEKLHLAGQTMGALGQVVRNFSANLDGPRKLAVLKQSYLLGLRTLGRVMEVFGKVIEHLNQITNEDSESYESLASLRLKVDGIIAGMTQLYAFYIFSTISSNIGVLDMERAYNAVLQQMDRTVAIRMLAINIQMHHFSAFPETEIYELYESIKLNKFALDILHWLVATYLTLNKVQPQTFNNMAKLFRMSPAQRLEMQSHTD